VGPADQADGFENGSAGEICDDNSSLDLHGTASRTESAAARHGRLAVCNDHGSSTGAHGSLWNSSSRCIYIHMLNLLISTTVRATCVHENSKLKE